MKLALNGATTMRADLATDLHAAKAAGFDYLEIWAAKLRAFLKERSTAELKDLFAGSGLSPLSINSIEHVTFRDATAYESIKRECEELSSIAAAVGCPCIVVVPGRLPLPPGGAARETVIAESVRVLNELCDIAAAHDVSLAFEFLGQPDCSVPTLDLAHEIVREVNRKDLGVVIDNTDSTDQALAAIRWSAGAYEVVITNMNRADSPTAGLDLISRIREKNADKQIILFINQYDPNRGWPPGVRVVTNEVDVLLHHVFDAISLERSKEKRPNSGTD